MMIQIQAKYLAHHDALGSRKDAINKELFDTQHAQIWANCDADLRARKAELKTRESLTDEERIELAELEVMFPTISEKAQKQQEAFKRATDAIKANATAAPWGRILNDLAIGQGWIEP